MNIDVDSILAPIPGDNPAGTYLRYENEYSDIKEARRADDLLDKGEWQHEVKISDWRLVEKLTVDALTQKTKDLQIAVWLTEALIKQLGFQGLAVGFDIMTGLLTQFWDHLYPEIDEGDLDYRAAPIDFFNEKLCYPLKDIAVTDPRTTSGYSWNKWEESRRVGTEDSIKNQWGDVDESRKEARDVKISEGKIPVEEFDGAVARSSFSFYKTLLGDINQCREKLERFDQVLDEKFGDEAPRLAEFRSALEACHELIEKLHKEKADKEPVPEPAPPEDTAANVETPADTEEEGINEPTMGQQALMAPIPVPVTGGAAISHLTPISDGPAEALWNEAIQILKTSGIKTALAQLMSAGCSAPSVREKNRYRLIMAKLCLAANRLDLARPIAEELYTLIEELSLEKWESPVWIGDVIDTLYQCLTKAQDADDNAARAQELLEKLCRTDVTKAMTYNS